MFRKRKIHLSHLNKSSVFISWISIVRYMISWTLQATAKVVATWKYLLHSVHISYLECSLSCTNLFGNFVAWLVSLLPVVYGVNKQILFLVYFHTLILNLLTAFGIDLISRWSKLYWLKNLVQNSFDISVIIQFILSQVRQVILARAINSFAILIYLWAD